MRNPQSAQVAPLQDQVRKTREEPFLAACTTPVSEAQILMLDQVETLSLRWVMRRRRGVQATCAIVRHWAANNPLDPFGATRNMVDLAAGSIDRFAEDVSETSQLWLQCWADLTKVMTVASLIGAGRAEAVIPIKAANHSTPL